MNGDTMNGEEYPQERNRSQNQQANGIGQGITPPGATTAQKLPPLFHVDTHYTYYRQTVKYLRRDDQYYYFDKHNGAHLQIDPAHEHIIIGERIKIR